MSRKSILPLHAPPTESLSHRAHYPTLTEIREDPVSQLAEKYWSNKKENGWVPDIVETIFSNELLGAVNLEKVEVQKKVMLLEFSQYLEKYLWPHYNVETATMAHTLTIIILVNEKHRQRIPLWDTFIKHPSKFPAFFHQALTFAFDQSLSLELRTSLLIFFINCFQSLETGVVRTECMKLVGIGVWHNLGNEELRERIFKGHPNLKKLWNATAKRYESVDEETKTNIIFERKWLSQMLVQFIGILYEIPEQPEGDIHIDIPFAHLSYVERFIEFLIDLESQLPTRRHFNTLLEDHQILVLIRRSSLFHRPHTSETELFHQLLDNLQFYSGFEVNDFTGQALSREQMTERHTSRIMELQRVAFRDFQTTLEDLALTNIGALETRGALLKHLDSLDDTDIQRLCRLLGLRDKILVELPILETRTVLLESLVARHERRLSQIDRINSLPLYSDETTLFSETLTRTQFYSGARPLALPKLNLQFLTLHDYLLRNFTLFRLESTYEIRQDIEDVVKRLAPRCTYPEKKTEFTGWARMGIEVKEFEIVDIGRPELGETKPGWVKADVTFSLARYTNSIRDEWDALKPFDVLFLLSIRAHEDTTGVVGEDQGFREHFGLQFVRGCEIESILGPDGKPLQEFGKLRSSSELKEKRARQGTMRTIRLRLDPNQYKLDQDRGRGKGGQDIYESFNVLVRRRPQENNFKSVLETIRDLMQSDLVVPEWLQKVFLGYGDPTSANYAKLGGRRTELDFRDTFLNWEHLVESFPGRKVIAEGANEEKALEPPYRIKFSNESNPSVDKAERLKKRKKLKKDTAMEIDETEDSNGELLVDTYRLPNMGPYPEDVRKKNAVKFTPAQVEAIHSGMNPGLTCIVGPPGTGKTDVAVQIIANIYHNNPEQHTLLVTHSNQALNQIFEKIIALDIDERHLLRLGHGEEELNTELSFSKYGRVDSFLQRRLELLTEVNRLGYSLGIPGEHGSSCETAGYFYSFHVVSRWEPFIKNGKKSQDVEFLRTEFPFTDFFSNIPGGMLFPEGIEFNAAIEIAEGCFRHLQKMFTELEEIRAFELLRTGYDRANYLLTKEAKIIAMTCTHAALKRRELVDLNFKYDNIVMEEAAQILEVETFVPMLLQEPEDGHSRLKRVVLIGDHNQLPPIVKNMAFQQYGNMEQSLFARFVRLGVPHIELDAQGRARSSIADLYRWRYNKLGDLPIIEDAPEYTTANTGFTYDYQLINVQDYQGKGESEPVPYFYQNLGEAEYIVAVYQYMRLIGYPAEKISILTTYNGQKALIRDVLKQRCSWNPLFGEPSKVTTVDKYQGQQNDYILLSLVRTRSVGHIRDVRRLVVAMSRARLGLYVFCRRALFENCYELRPAFTLLLKRPDTLSLRLQEMYPTARLVSDHADPFVINDVSHIGAYTYQMMQEQVKFVKDQAMTEGGVTVDASMDVDGKEKETDEGGDRMATDE